MRIKIDGKEYKIPGSLMDITLAERIEFDNLYGKALKKQLGIIADMPDDVNREIEFTDYHLQLATKTLSFFGKIPLEIVEQTQIDEVLTLYHHTLKGYSEDVDFTDKEFELQREFEWMDETWEIGSPMLKHDSTMTFAEFLDAKQSVKNLYELGEEKWSAMINLACVYFRKKGEDYKDDFIYEEGERYKLMKTLPLQYAIHIGFFLKGLMGLYLNTYPSLLQTTATAEVQN